MSKDKEIDYKKLQAELDEILAWFSADNFELDEATKKYERALEITNSLDEYLRKAENQITRLKEKFE